jgi:RNA polymerase sigma factor (sigma-70 family)
MAVSSTAPEKRLARQARDGDQGALAQIFSDYHQPLYRYCLAIVGNRADAEDALQETMVKVLRSLPGEQREIALRPWLYRVAHNESIQVLRRRRDNVTLEGTQEDPVGGLAEQVEVRERLRQLVSDLGALPERQRGVLLMREAAGLDFEEIGAALETTPAVARQTLYEARLGLREMDAGREMNCAAVTQALSDGDRRVLRRRDIRAHLRECAGCRGFAEEIDSRKASLTAIAPLPAVAATALLHGALAGGSGAGAAAAGAGGAGAAGGAGSGGAVGAGAAAGAAKSIGTAALLKGAATVAVVAAIGVGAADEGGLIHLGKKAETPASQSSPPLEEAEGSTGARSSDPTVDEGDGIDRPATGATGADGGQPATRSTLGQARKAQSQSKSPTSDGKTAAAADPVNTASAEGPPGEAPGNSATGQNGGGHEKETSASAAHGQETAAANHAAHQAGESASGKGASGHPEHPIHPTHPAKSAKVTKPERPPKAVKEAPPAAESPAPASEAPEAAAEHAANPPGQSK